MLRCIYQKEKRKGGISMFSQPFLVFLQVAESGSFSKAAARLLVTPTSVMKTHEHLWKAAWASL